MYIKLYQTLVGKPGSILRQNNKHRYILVWIFFKLNIVFDFKLLVQYNLPIVIPVSLVLKIVSIGLDIKQNF